MRELQGYSLGSHHIHITFCFTSFVVLYSGAQESVVIENSVIHETPSEPEDKAEHSPLLTEEDTSTEETRQLQLKTTTNPQVSKHSTHMAHLVLGIGKLQ